MKHTKKLLSVLLAALLLAGCCALAFSASAAGNAPQTDLTENLVVVKYDTDDLQDGDWYFDTAAYAEAFKQMGWSDDEIAASIYNGKRDQVWLFNPNNEELYLFSPHYYDNGDPAVSVYEPGEESYSLWRSLIKQYQAPAPAGTDTPAPAGSVCPWCGGVHEGFFQGIVGWFHGILANLFGAKF